MFILLFDGSAGLLGIYARHGLRCLAFFLRRPCESIYTCDPALVGQKNWNFPRNSSTGINTNKKDVPAQTLHFGLGTQVSNTLVV